MREQSEKSIIPLTTNADLRKERETCSFSVEEFQNWWHGGAAKLKAKREIEEYLFKDVVGGHDHDYLSHEDLYNDTVKKVTEASQKLRKLQHLRNPGGNDIWPKLLYDSVMSALTPAHHPFATHCTMFVDVIRNQGTAEQIEEFGKLADNCNIIGTYAQTELAHGTNVRGIETRADYDATTDEFILNTPSLHAYKWWPGGMGHTANYAMVVAQLYIDGDHKGIQMFIVPLRDRDSHMPLPGIDIGEIGKKVGMHAVNQGFLGLSNVRIPRTNMLMRFAKVLPGGRFIESIASKVNYMTMVYTRCLIVSETAALLLQSATIGTRYSAVRRQSPINPKEREPQILDHVTQQLKVLPEIAAGMAYRLAANAMWEMYDRTLKEIDQGEFLRLPEMHIMTCALKVLCTTDACLGIERLRLACGGHGYLSSANFGTIYGNAVAAYTYEGENTVLLLQIGRFLVKSWHRLTNGEKLLPSVAYFDRVYHNTEECPQWDNSWQCIVKSLQYAAAQKTRIAFANLSKRIIEGQTEQEAANNTGIDLIQAAELHSRQLVAASFLEQITGAKSAERSVDLNNVLENLLELFLVQTAFRQMNEILRFLNLTDGDLRALQTRLEVVLTKLRPDAVAICDGFAFHDLILNSVLGSYDGNVYERIFNAAKKSPMNQMPVPKSFEQHLKPFMKSNL